MVPLRLAYLYRQRPVRSRYDCDDESFGEDACPHYYVACVQALQRLAVCTTKTVVPQCHYLDAGASLTAQLYYVLYYFA